jgi:periplasmic protein TonB
MARSFSEGVYRIGGGVSVPRFIISQQPEYTAEARAARIEGVVEPLATVGQDGIPRDLRIQKALGFGLDEEAVRCVSGWRFSPGGQAGSPVPVAATLRVKFRLESVKAGKEGG